MARRKFVGLSVSTIFALLLGLNVWFLGTVPPRMIIQPRLETQGVARTQTSYNYTDHGPISVTNDTQLLAIKVNGSGTSNDPYILEGWNITTSSSQHGISISGTTKYFIIQNNFIDTGGLSTFNGININNILSASNGTATITNNIVQNSDTGIFIQSGKFSLIANNTCRQNLRFGIATADGGENTSIIGNFLLQNTEAGIRLESSETSAINNTILGSSGSDNGINVDRDNSTILNNTIRNCGGVGIGFSPVRYALVTNNYVDGCSGGINGWPSESLFANNSLLNGKEVGNIGITLNGESGVDKSDNNTFLWNLVMNYVDYAVDIFGNGAGNIFHHNAFIHDNFNNPGSPQARDNSTNRWYDIITNEGNYWHDYSGSGNYTLVGGTEDPFPLTSIDLDRDLMADGWEYDNNLDPTDATDATGDLDADGLSNVYEYQNGLNASNKDTDGDQMPDGFEINSGLDPLNKSDADLDLDGDQMPNQWEYQHGFNVTWDDSQEDADEDTLTNVNEYMEGTDPLNNDTDSDGLIDGIEVHTTFTDPTNSDSDSDGLSDSEEVNTYNTDPNDNDSDDDGVTDGDEVAAGTDPNNKDVFPTTTTTTTTQATTSGWRIILLILSLLVVVRLHRKKE